ncbi:MAG: HAMP domain-containing protein [Deltaproteobacteria bacterium]|nr:HAMP domain-containing protein [Deltaproteobacteria bacterium]
MLENGSTPEVLKDQRKRWWERVLMGLTLVLVVAITSLEVYLVRQGGQEVTDSLLAFGLLNINTFLLLLLTFLIFRNLTKLFLERRRKVFGSRLRTRLVLTFITLTMLPAIFLFFMAWQLLAARVDFSLERQVEESLERALDLSRNYAQEMENKLMAAGRLLAPELRKKEKWILEDQEILDPLLARFRDAYQLTGLEILNPAGYPLARSYEPNAPPLPRLPQPEDGEEKVLHQKTATGDLLSYVLPVKDLKGALKGYVVVRDLVPQSYLLQAAAANRNLQELRQRQRLFSPLRVTHYLTLIIVTLIAVMSAVWLGFYMAREITTPIRQLAEGALKVAGGDYDIKIQQEGRDEIGFLVQSFNKMTQDLQHSQAQLAAAYRQLSDSHALISAQKRDMEILLKNVAAGVIGIDQEGRIITINDSAAQLLGVDRDEVLGQDARILVPPGEFDRLAEVVQEARQAPRGTVEKHLHLILKDRPVYLLLKPTVLKDDAGRDLGMVIVFEDLTDLERAQRLAAWREVARHIAHEVKNPLTPIKLAAQRLRRRYLDRFGDGGQIFDECTQIIISQVDELKNLVNEFSHFARLPHLSLAPQDLNLLVQEVLLLYQEAQPRINLEFHPDPELPPLWIDREQIKRVLLNLLDNALGSISGTGAITITLKGGSVQGMVELVVSDTGVGILDRDKRRIFEPYFSTKRGGTGLGLAIVNSIVAEHQGHIRVEDHQPQGASFIIEIPIHRADYASDYLGSG